MIFGRCKSVAEVEKSGATGWCAFLTLEVVQGIDENLWYKVGFFELTL